MRAPLLVLFLVLSMLVGRADAALLTIEWVPYTGATSYDIEQATLTLLPDGHYQINPWTLVKSVSAKLCTTTKCSTPYTQPDNVLALFRIVTYNANGKTVNTKSGFWYNGGWPTPGAAGGAEIVKIQ